MKNIILLITLFGLISCNDKPGISLDEDNRGHDLQEHDDQSVHLSEEQFNALDMNVGMLSSRIISDLVEANGQLEVPPQNEAVITAVLGGNISSINVLEGDEVNEGQVLAYLSHPDLIRIQSDYLESFTRLEFLEKEFQREKKLYEEEVGSGKKFQEVRADYNSARYKVSSYEAQLRQLGLYPPVIREGNLHEKIPVSSPIHGTITFVNVKIGQYAEPQKTLFEVVDVKHVHADLMIFEKDVHKVEEGQYLRFTVETLPEAELMAEIYSVGKKFEQEPKAVHVHAEIENKSGKLLPGMYIKGQIITHEKESTALPEKALARDGDSHIAFVLKETKNDQDKEWIFEPVRVITGLTDNGWTEIRFLERVSAETLFALNNAYYLLAEMKKGEGGHHH